MSRLIFAEHGWDDYIYWQILVYVVTDDGIIIEQCKGHYDDK